jgi:aryl-alcohol dehydrogenase-like predicted oxidoreductase
MDRRHLGVRGPEVSRLALGTMTFGAESDEAAAQEILDVFVEAGGVLIDTADVYADGQSERFIGEWLRARPGMRDQVVLATKGRFPVTGQPGASLRASYLRSALDASLTRLAVDHVDLYQVHGPDLSTPLEEVAEFFQEAVASGKTTYVGTSNLPGWQIAKLALLCEQADVPLVAHQPQYSLLAREVEWEVIPAAIDAGLGALVWGPLGAGWLTGKYRRGEPPPARSRLGEDPDRGVEAWDRRGTEFTWAVIDRLLRVAEEHEVPPAQAALAWVADRRGVVSAIVGARTADQLRETIAAGSFHLDPAATTALDQQSAPGRPDYPYGFIAEWAGVGGPA